MPRNLSVRNVEDEIIARLKRRAARHGQSAEAEVRDILRQALDAEPLDDWAAMAAQFRALTADRKHTPSEVLLREGRDER